jgi:dienelactone hydrolase
VRAQRGLGAGLAAVAVVLVGCGGGSSARGNAAPSTFAYDRNEPFKYVDKGVVNRNYPIKIHDVSFASARSGRVHAYLVVPPGKGPFPAVIWAHGSGVTRNDLLLQAAWFAARGSIELVPDDPFERNPQLSFASDARQRAAVVQQVIDLRRGVDLLLSRQDVDGKRIAFAGLSFGAIQGAFLAGVEPRIGAFDLQSGRGRSLGPGLDPRVWIRRSHAHFFIQDGLHDRVVPRAQLQALARAAPRPKIVRWYDAPHGLNTGAVHDQLRWLARQLGLDAPVVRGAVAGP